MFENLTKCVECGGRKFCWNSETKQIEEVINKPISIPKCPPEVLQKLLTLLSNNEINKEK